MTISLGIPKLKPQIHSIKFLLAILLSIDLLLSFVGCGEREQTGSCNQFCGDIQRISSQTKSQCAVLGKKSTCPTQWLARGADENDRKAWVTVFPVPVEPEDTTSANTVTAPDTLAPGIPLLNLELTAINGITLKISPNTADDGVVKYDITRNGETCESCLNGRQFFNPLDAIFRDYFLEELTEYCYGVVAIDLSGNRSIEKQSCLSTPSFFLKWKKEISDDFSQITSNLSGNIYIARSNDSAEGSILQAFDSNGALTWEFMVEDAYFRKEFSNDYYLLENNGKVYFVTSTNTYCISKTGTLLWRIQYGSPIFRGNDESIVSISSNEIRAIDRNGKELWTYTPELPEGVSYVSIDVSSVSVNLEGVVYFQVRSSRTLLALNSDGSLRSDFNVSTAMNNIQTAVDPDGNLYYTVNKNLVRAVTANSSLIWEYSVDEAVASITFGANNRLYISAIKSLGNKKYTGYIYTLTSNDGKLDWSYEESGSIGLLRTGSNHRLMYKNSRLFSSVDQAGATINHYTLNALDQSGRKIWSYLLNSSEVRNFSSGNDGSIYFWNKLFSSFDPE